MIDNVGGISSVKSIIQRFNWNCKIAEFQSYVSTESLLKNIELSSLNIFPSKTHCSLVMQYGDTDLGQHWLMKLLVAWWHQAIIWTNTIKSILWYYSPERNFTRSVHEINPLIHSDIIFQYHHHISQGPMSCSPSSLCSHISSYSITATTRLLSEAEASANTTGCGWNNQATQW